MARLLFSADDSGGAGVAAAVAAVAFLFAFRLFSPALASFLVAAAVILLLSARRSLILENFPRAPGARMMKGVLPETGSGGAVALMNRIGDRRGRNGVSERSGLPGMESLLRVPLLTSAPSGAL